MNFLLDSYFHYVFLGFTTIFDLSPVPPPPPPILGTGWVGFLLKDVTL